MKQHLLVVWRVALVACPFFAKIRWSWTGWSRLSLATWHRLRFGSTTSCGYLWTHAPNQPISSHSIPSRTAYVPKRRRSSRPPVGCSSMWLSALVGGCDALNPMNEAKPENFGPLIVWQVKRFSSCPFAKVGWKIRQRVSPEEGGFASWPGGLGSWSSDPLMTG